MRKLPIFISYLFLLSFSIYAQGDDERIDLVEVLTECLEIYPHPKSTQSIENRGLTTSNVSIFSPTQKMIVFPEEPRGEINIVRLCAIDKENFNIDTWEKYKKEILERCQARYPFTSVKRGDDGSILSIKDPQDQYVPILFHNLPVSKEVDVLLSDDVKNELLNIMNAASNYEFVTVNVKITSFCVEKDKLPIYIAKNGGGNFFDDLSTDDTHIYTEDDQPMTKIYFEYSELSLSRLLHRLTWSYLSVMGGGFYNYLTGSNSN
ncbi:MAG: hypothetical protein PUP46_06470 [Endozoicomonas sp. (ex Botrylloides leachii)]|nr:hypothetical protein [Endozoicomonas sp. (ex Botrylloides leachii)]